MCSPHPARGVVLWPLPSNKSTRYNTLLSLLLDEVAFHNRTIFLVLPQKVDLSLSVIVPQFRDTKNCDMTHVDKVKACVYLNYRGDYIITLVGNKEGSLSKCSLYLSQDSRVSYWKDRPCTMSSYSLTRHAKLSAITWDKGCLHVKNRRYLMASLIK
jgi:hypothetical protein